MAPGRAGALAALFFLALAMVVAAPSQAPGQPRLELTPQSTVVGGGGTMQYQAVLRDGGALPQYLDPALVTWSSSDATVLSVDTGIATGHQPGSATITAQFQGLTAQAPATVAGTVHLHSLITPDGRTRTYVLYTPAGYTAAAPAPLMLAYHGTGGTGEGMMHVTLMNAVAHRNGFLVVYPDGLGSATAPTGWNSGDDRFQADIDVDDVEFTRRVIEDVAGRRTVDPTRVYATGMSNGALMTQRLGFDLADRIAAIAPVAGALDPTGGGFVRTPPIRPVSMIQFQGTTDRNERYDPTVLARFAAWLDRNQIPSASRLISYRRGIVTCETSASSEAVATLCIADPPAPFQVDGVVYDGGGHAWPGGQRGPSGWSDVPTQDIDASETIWAFLSAFGRLEQSGQRLAAAVLPGSRAASVGGIATAFVTIINPGPSVASDVTITPAIPSPAGVSFRSTDPSTNLPVGAPDVPVDIPPGEARTFVVSVEPTAPFDPAEMVFGFGGPTTVPVTPLRGINTLMMSAEIGPVFDAVALVATPTGDGILNLPGPGQAAAFAVASVNVGAGGPASVQIDTGGLAVPIVMGICQTDPATSVCVSPIGPSVSLDMPAGATPTFGVFVVSDGIVSFDPAVNRIFVRFLDGRGVIRGSTSVAVRTR